MDTVLTIVWWAMVWLFFGLVLALLVGPVLGRRSDELKRREE